ncbi:AMP-binding enzyme, partial [Escherichia coli]|uniref:AMP-binding enzyme n=2 Tax=Escherichia coli TaxID=562 RepID=UPI003EBE4B62
CHGTVCVVGKIRDLIPQLSKSSIYSTKPRLGERSCAYVVLKAPYHSLSLEEVVAFFSRKRVAKYKYPEHIVVIEKLPRTASGKIQKFLLRKDIMRRLTQDVCEEIE